MRSALAEARNNIYLLNDYSLGQILKWNNIDTNALTDIYIRKDTTYIKYKGGIYKPSHSLYDTIIRNKFDPLIEYGTGVTNFNIHPDSYKHRNILFLYKTGDTFELLHYEPHGGNTKTFIKEFMMNISNIYRGLLVPVFQTMNSNNSKGYQTYSRDRIGYCIIYSYMYVFLLLRTMYHSGKPMSMYSEHIGMYLKTKFTPMQISYIAHKFSLSVGYYARYNMNMSLKSGSPYYSPDSYSAMVKMSSPETRSKLKRKRVTVTASRKRRRLLD